MSINEEIQKAQALERQALNKLNGGKSWIERHPGWTLMIGVVLLLGDVILAFKAYG